MLEQICIRDVMIGDLYALASLHCRCWQHTYPGVLDQSYLDALTPQTFADYHQHRLAAPSAAHPFLVATDPAGQILAFALGGPTRQQTPTGDALSDEPHQKYTAEVFAIYVAPEVQGRGLGWQLWNATLQRLRNNGHESLCVWVLTNNALARRFYERAGGAIDGESPITLGDRSYRQVLYGWPTL